jgi:hypothetical protein
MTRLITSLVIGLFLFINTLFSQEIQGDWHGQLNVQGTKLRISFHIQKDNNTYKTTMDSPDQMAFGIPTDETLIVANKVTISG